jgi:hypothetical protein
LPAFAKASAGDTCCMLLVDLPSNKEPVTSNQNIN